MQYFVSLKSTKISGAEKVLLEKPEVCGVVLFGVNILGLATTKRFITEIKAVKPSIKIAIDEEGGIVSRIGHLMANYSQPYVATLPSTKAREYYKKRSHLLKELGIDLNFAPVVDISLSESSYTYKRSYGSDLNKIIELARICIEEQKKAGILSCIKHFPGHGRAIDDSHEKLPIVNISQSEWNKVESKIFQGIIESGVEYVMVGHLLFPQINNEISSVSSYWIRNVLKKQLHFKGKIISDDICMKGLYESINTGSAQIFKDAGLDELIIVNQKHPLLNN
jgi:beta-N-acetylhexosaminidase